MYRNIFYVFIFVFLNIAITTSLLAQHFKSTDAMQSFAKNKKSRSLGYNMTTEINASKFPIIDIIAEITDDNSHPITMLTALDFDIFEDGRYQPVLNVVSPIDYSFTKAIDIVFVHDESGSMCDEALQLKNNIQVFVDRLRYVGMDVRIGLLAYGGNGMFSEPHGTVLHNGQLHSSVESFIEDIDQMKFNGNMEQAFCAIHKAIQQIYWRSSSQKMIILITDEDNNPGNLDWPCNTSQESVIDLLIQNNITLYGIVNETWRNTTTDFLPLAQQTNGKLYNTTDDFLNIFKDIASCTSNYLIQYKTDNLESNTLRKVNISTINSYGISLSNTVNYLVNPITIVRTDETVLMSNTGQRAGVPIHISAEISQSDSPVIVKLFYKSSLTDYQFINMTASENSIYTAIIEYSDFIPQAIYYYISATNDSGTKTLPSVDSSLYPFVIPVLPKVPPIITQHPITQAETDQPISIKGIVEDVTDKIVSIELHYKSQGDNVYKVQKVFPNVGKYHFNFEIPIETLKCNDVLYYIVAKDNDNIPAQIGSADRPNTIKRYCRSTISTVQRIGNINVYADRFIQVSQQHIIASGNVCIGKATGTQKLLKTQASLNLRYDTMQINTISSNELDVLDIKRSINGSAEIIPLYSGHFKINCNDSPPVLIYENGESRLKLINDIPFIFPVSGSSNTAFIDDDAIQLNNIYTHISDGIEGTLFIGDILLSQSGQTTTVKHISDEELTEVYTIDNTNWKLSNLDFNIDLLNSIVKANGELTIPGVIENDQGGIPAELQFLKNDALSLESISGNLSFPKIWNQPLIIPSKQSLGISVTNLEKSSFQVSGITSSNQPTLNGSCSMILYDNMDIIKTIYNIYNLDLLSGDTSIRISRISPGKKCELYGDMNFLGAYPITNAKLTFGSSLILRGRLEIDNISFQLSDGTLSNATGSLRGDISLRIGLYNGELLFRGSSFLFLTMPEGSEWISDESTISGMYDIDFRFSKFGIEHALISNNYIHNFSLLKISIDFSTPRSPVIKIENLIPELFGSSKKQSKSLQDTFLLNESIDPLIIKYLSENSVPEFLLTLPDGLTYEPVIDQPIFTNGYEISFNSAPETHESYYTILHPPKGDYTVTMLNENLLGSYNRILYTPNSQPEITLLSPIADIIWDQGTTIPISWLAEDTDDDAMISLYYDEDNQGNDGVLIADNISENYSENHYAWDVGDHVLSGSYFIYAQIDDGVNLPQYNYNEYRVFINNPLAPVSPQNLQVFPSNGSLLIQWKDNSEPDISGYRVYIGRNPGSHKFEYQFYVQSSRCKIDALTNGLSYEIAVSAMNTSFLESQLCESISVEITGTSPQGIPDLILDVEGSTVSSLTGKLEGPLTITARIKNISSHDSYSARIECYYDQLLPSNRIDAQLIPGISANQYLDVYFQIDSDAVLSKDCLKYFYINITESILPELNTTNNLNHIINKLTLDHTIVLQKGDNFFRLMLDPDERSIPAFFNSIMDHVQLISTFQDNQWNYYQPDILLDECSLKNVSPGTLYYIQMAASETLAVTGKIYNHINIPDNNWEDMAFDDQRVNAFTESYTVSSSKGEKAVFISEREFWTASTHDNWISFPDGNTSDDSEMLNIAYTANIASEKTGIINIHSSSSYTTPHMILIHQTANTAPQIELTPELTLFEDTPLRLTINISDMELPCNNLYLSGISGNNHLISQNKINMSCTELIITPEKNSVGRLPITLTASDGNLTTYKTIDINICPVNDPPFFTSDDVIIVFEDDGEKFVDWAGNISPGPIDEQDQTIAFQIVPECHEFLKDGPIISNDGILRFTLMPDKFGDATFDVTLKDSGGTEHNGQNISNTQKLHIIIQPVNDCPSFVIGPDQKIKNHDGPQFINQWITNISSGAYESDQKVQFHIQTENEDLLSSKIEIQPDGTLQFAPRTDKTGKTKVTVYATDDGSTDSNGCNTSLKQSFEIEISQTYLPSLWELELTVERNLEKDIQQTVDQVNIGIAPVPYTYSKSSAPENHSCKIVIFDSEWNSLQTDVFQDGKYYYQWILGVDPHGDITHEAIATTAMLHWNLSDIPDNGHMVLVDESGFKTDMHDHDSKSVSGKTYVLFTLQWHIHKDFIIELYKGWNLISSPIQPSTTYIKELFPQAIEIYEFSNGSYFRPTYFSSGKGYWIKYPQNKSIPLLGQSISDKKQQLSAGWHLIGASEKISSLSTIPDTALSEIQGLSGNTYQDVSELDPGKGYWIYLKTDGTLIW